MTSRYDAYLAALANRDFAFGILLIISLSLIAAWCLLDFLPTKAQRILHRAYLVGGLVLYCGTILITVGGLVVYELR